MKKPIEEILADIENNWDKRQGWIWRIRNKFVYNFMRNLYEKGMPKVISDPAIDEEEDVFSFYAKPSMQLGIPGDNQATRVDSDGQLETRNGKFLFLIGDPLEKVQKRIWTLTKGYLPEINYSLVKKNCEFSFRAFQFGIDGVESPINFIQVDIENLLNERNNVSLYFGYLFSLFSILPNLIYNLFKKHPRFNKKWAYNFVDKNQAIRDKNLLYLSDQEPTALHLKLDERSNHLIPYRNAYKKGINKDTITLIQEFRLDLSPNEKSTLTFKVPHYPINILKGDEIKRLDEADVIDRRKKFEKFWEDILIKCMSIEVPEDKVTNTHKTSLIFNFMCQNFHDEGTLEQHVNRFQYNMFWLRDSSFYSKMYSCFNRPDIAKRLLLHFLNYQDKEGNFCSQSGQLDGWGQTLWAFGEYIKLTRDEEFAEKVFNPIMKAIEYLKKLIDKDKWGVMPPRFAADNEMISGRYTGHNFWAWHGLNNAIYIAEFLKKEEEQAQIQLLRQQFLNSFIPILNKICEHHNNRVPPGLDTDIGEDWSNLLMLYPLKLLDIDDPKVRATLEDYRTYKMPEGIAMWMIFLHHYITERIAQQHLILDDQELVLRDLYSMLSHTGACHGGFEHNIRPWGNRDYLVPIRVLYLKMDYYNYPPHGWFAVAYNQLLRNMLIREEDNNLHLLSAISPEWIEGDISVKHANTYFGICEFELTKLDKNLQFTFKCSYERKKPDKLIIHIPYFIEKESLKLSSDKNLEFNETKTMVVIDPIEEIRIKIDWDIDNSKDLSYLSYEKAVKWLIDGYYKRYLEQ